MRNPWMIRLLIILMRLRFRRMSRFWQALLGVEIPYPFPSGLILPHPYGVVVNFSAKIGHNCKIYQNVTIGSDRFGQVPTIGRNVTIYAGACILGDVRIGNDVVVGANAVVLKDVPDGMTAVGVPARIIDKRNE